MKRYLPKDLDQPIEVLGLIRLSTFWVSLGGLVTGLFSHHLSLGLLFAIGTIAFNKLYLDKREGNHLAHVLYRAGLWIPVTRKIFPSPAIKRVYTD